MPSEFLPIDLLRVNPANDRHGEVQDEDAAFAELFRLRGQHMRALARDLADQRRLYELPLVHERDGVYLVFDGNRRITCLKLILEPQRAPNLDLVNFFQEIHNNWEGPRIDRVECQIEDDLEIIDSILYRRHTGSQGGVGQSPWDPRAKRNFQLRTGRGDRIDIAEEIEGILAERQLLPDRPIPTSTMNRLLSSEATRNRLGISALNGQFRITHQTEVVVPALARVASDLANRVVVLADVWSNEDKRRYLDQLEGQRILPRAEHFIEEGRQEVVRRRGNPQRRRQAVPPRPQTTFIPLDAEAPNWLADQQRIRMIWDELQNLNFEAFPNAVSALMRILLELSVESYLAHHEIVQNGTLSQKVRSVIDSLQARGAIDNHHYSEIERMRRGDELISISSIQRFVHSPRFAPMPNELVAYWMRLGTILRLMNER